METSRDFTLNKALEAWRASLSSLATDDLAEIEGHLDDSMAGLREAGLSEFEAFLIARHRLGSPAEWAVGFAAVPVRSETGGANGLLAAFTGSCSKQRVLTRFGVLALVAAIASSAWLVFAPKRYLASAEMEVIRDSTGTQIGSFKSPARITDSSASNEEFLATQFEVLTSREALARVAKEQRLMERWGLADREKAIDRLGRMVKATRKPGTNLIRVSALGADPKEAAGLAEALVNAYHGRRSAQESLSVEMVFVTLTQATRGQELLVGKALKRMTDLAKELNISDPAPNGGAFSGPSIKEGEPANYTAYNQAKEDHQLQLKILQDMTAQKELARLVNLMPRMPVIFHEHAVEPSKRRTPNPVLWTTIAVISGALGLASLFSGRRLRPKPPSGGAGSPATASSTAPKAATAPPSRQPPPFASPGPDALPNAFA